MIDEIAAHKASAKAVRAKSLLEHELFLEAFKSLEETYTERMLSTNMGQGEEREKLYLAVRVLREVKRHIGSFIDDGKIADVDLKKLAEIAKRKSFSIL